MAAVAQQAYQAQSYGQHYHVNGQSVMQDVSDEDDEDDSMRGDPELDDDGDLTMTPDQMHFYQQQQQQALYYQQHTQQHGTNENAAGPSRRSSTHESASGQGVEEDDEVYSDDESSTASIPDDNIDFSLTYALHTFLATVEGQASVVKGDSLLLLDDANSYWWLVRVLKTEDVGYIPAENIETPYERLARLNKHRNVDLAAATQQEKQAGTVQGRERLKNAISGKAKSVRQAKAGEEDASGSRRVEFAPPTYVEHPGVTWSSDEEDEEDEGDVDLEEVERSQDDIRPDGDDVQNEREVNRVEESLVHRGSGIDMEPDDGVEWADGAGQNEQKRVLDQKQSGMRSPPPPANAIIPKSNNPFAPRNQPTLGQVAETTYPSTTNSVSSLASSHPGGSPVLDPAQAQETRRITATPQVAQGSGGPLLPSAALSNANGARNVSGQSIGSVTSVVSSTSTRSATPTSPSSEDKTLKKTRSKGSKEDLVGDGKKKSRGMLGGLFSRKSKDKDKKGISSIDPRSSEESMISGAMDSSPASQGRLSNDQHGPPGIVVSPPMSTHGARMAQREQATQQSYANKYLSRSQSGDLRSPSTAEAAAAVAQSAAAMRLAAGMTGDTKARPSSIILSPNPAGPPLLNVMRVFAGDHIRSEASFKTVLLNETTVASDLIRQAIQRFHLHHGSRSSSEENYFLTVKDVSGEETELAAMEKPLAVFQETVQRYADDQSAAKTDAIKTVKRSSVSSISSVMSLSNHPAIAKLGMNDYSDDSTVKLYLNRRRPHSQQANGGMPEPNSEFSSYSTQLSTVQESVSESASWDASSNATETLTASPPTPQAQPRYNTSLTISTNGQASPERFSSPSARFTVQLRIHPADLPDGLVFDPSSDAIIPRSVLRERQMNDQSASMPDFRRRLLVMPRNATVVEAIEQALDKFGIQEGVVDGGDDVEDRAGKRRSQAKVRYTLSAVSNGQERRLLASGKLLEAYSTPPNLRPLDRTTPEQRRRSRDMSGGQSTASAADLLPSDPVFVLRRVISRPLSTGRREPLDDLALAQKSAGVLQKQQAVPSLANGSIPEASRGALSPQEIIAAQRAASRANQKALISANANQQQGVDIHLPARGTFRSSRIIGSGEVRYSFIDDGGETYDISELLEEEWGPDGSKSSPEILQQPPPLLRAPTDQSVYITAPSTPDETGEPSTRKRSGSSASVDILQTAIERSAGKPNEKLEEKLQRVINKVKTSSGSTGPPRPESSEILATSSTSGRSTPPTGRSTPLARDRELSTLPEDNVADMTPRPERPDRSVARGIPPSASSSFVSTTSTGSDYQHTAASVNRIITRHRQQPSIASIMSDMSGPSPHWQADDDRSSTPVTATSSTHPTPPLFGAVFTRSVSVASPTPKAPVIYTDDFGIKAMMAVIQARAREEQGGWRPRLKSSRGTNDLLAVKGERHEAPDEADQVDEVQRTLYGERLDMADVYPDFRPIIGGLQSRLDGLDRDIDDLLASLAVKQEADE